MQYASFVLGDFKERGTRAFESSLPFDEEQTLNYIRSFIENELGLVDLKILRNIEVFEADRTNARQSAQPGRPSFYFYI